MKNPTWQRDELILALDLYFQYDYNKLSAKHPEVIILSTLLNLLPIFPTEKRTETFRNPEGVYMKLGNFLAIDPNDVRKGLPSFGKLDEIVFNEFLNNNEDLNSIANLIKLSIGDGTVAHQLASLNNDDDNEEIFSKEGKIIYRLHKLRERKIDIIKKKKDKVLRERGKLVCEICEFDFEAYYGIIGRGFIECHHIKPISQMTLGDKTRLEDLALVCSNCHRILHKDLNNSFLVIKEWILQARS